MAEYVRATSDVKAPLPKWMPEWVRQKSIDLEDVQRDHFEEVFRKLEDGGIFQRMEAAGGFLLSGEARGYLAGALATPLKFPLDSAASQRQRKRQKLAKKVEALAEQIEAELDAVDYFLMSPAIELPLRLREYAQMLDRTIDHETLFRVPGPELNKLLKLARESHRQLVDLEDRFASKTIT